MPDSIFLTPDELKILTGRQVGKAQARVLDEMGIPYMCNGLGRIIMLRVAVEERLGRHSSITIGTPDVTALRQVTNHGQNQKKR